MSEEETDSLSCRHAQDAAVPVFQTAANRLRKSRLLGRCREGRSAAATFRRPAAICSRPGCRPDRKQSASSRRYLDFQDAHRTSRLKGARAESRRQQKNVAFSDFINSIAMLYSPRALHTYQHARHTGVTNPKRQFSAQAPQPEVIALKEPFAAYRRGLLHHGRHQAARARPKIY